MKVFFAIVLLLSLSAVGQEGSNNERKKIYQHVIIEFIDKDAFVINETFTPITRYDIDGNYEKWFYQSFPKSMVISVVPVKYESTVFDLLQSKGASLDTISIFRQIETFELDSLSKYGVPVKLIPFTEAPIRHSFFGNLFKKKKAVGLSRILFDEKNQIAIVKLQVYSKKKQMTANHSKIIILQKQGDDWKVSGVLQEELQPTATLQYGG